MFEFLNPYIVFFSILSGFLKGTLMFIEALLSSPYFVALILLSLITSIVKKKRQY